MKALCWLLILGLLFVGCGKQKETESPTSGVLDFICAESVAPVLAKEASEFQRLYTKASISLDSTTTREALVKFFNKETKMVVISRELNAEEKASLTADKLEYSSFVLAKDGVAVIVNPANPIKQLNLEQVRDIYSGKITRWSEVGGEGGEIVPLALSRNSGVSEVFFQTAGIGTAVSPALKVIAASREMVGMVAADASAIGFVGMNWLSDRVKALAIAKDTSGQFISIHQASVYNGAYPLVHSVYALTTAGAYGLASGFVAFLTSAPGQQIILDSGLVPVTMPVKLIRID